MPVPGAIPVDNRHLCICDQVFLANFRPRSLSDCNLQLHFQTRYNWLGYRCSDPTTRVCAGHYIWYIRLIMWAISSACSAPNCCVAHSSVYCCQLFCRPFIRVPGIIQKEADRKLHWFQIAHVYYPNLAGIILISQMHLLPCFRDGVCV